MDKTNRAAVEFSLSYTSEIGRHTDRIYVEKVDFWRDIIPGSLGKQLETSKLNETIIENFPSGTIIKEFDKKLIRCFKKELFNEDITPQPGRYYPVGHAWRGFDSFPNTAEPFRLMALENGSLVGDRNHPLAQKNVEISAKKLAVLSETNQRGGAINDIAELVSSNGPGMELPDQFDLHQTFGEEPFKRANNDDKNFYLQPRLTGHIDSLAAQQLTGIHAKLIKDNSNILDLMASCDSHLPHNIDNLRVTGLGMNEKELQTNSRLQSHLVQDLNHTPRLPFEDESFDAVICALSIEYLTRPTAVIREIERILQPGGIVIISVSDRWFPSKEVSFWKDLHPFERMGYIIQLLRTRETFKQINTESVRSYPRPETDRHYGKTFVSDPLFAVWSYKQI